MNVVQAGAVRDRMKLQELIMDVDTAVAPGAADVDITAIAYDSRRISPGSLFIAVRGFTSDGNTFIADAITKGAVAVVTDAEPQSPPRVPTVVVADARKAMAVIADRFYGSPQNEHVMTGVTGTNGKTTTTYMVRSIFEAGGMGCGVIGTIKHIVGNRVVESANTTPESPDIHSFLADMVKSGQSACAMEVSSHALALSRVYGIRFRAAAFLNITRDHLDFHGDFRNYLDSKGIIFTQLSGDSTAVINRDDPHAGHFITLSRNANVLTFGEHESSDIRLMGMKLEAFRSFVTLGTPTGTIRYALPVPGRFNVLNSMAAVGVARACGYPDEVIVRGLETVEPVRGRYEVVDEGQDFTVIVDYAHTPDALERILGAAREVTKGRLISVFGCGGDRDRGKRPLMGAVSERIADLSIVTSDNPRTEAPDAIIEDILKGIGSRRFCEIIPDREKAIRRPIEHASAGDTVVIAGKGHEDYQIVGTEKRHFDDAETARRLIRTKQ
ncbi:MAG: UDP-N-acetylmuramoyl-L-alanyl-D-glutamate--2,6-diaminopimelate ligase [Candidatus Latescibacteria bacterium]|nr:UDP-N-acetylmuramoyl-L-alanyl-D-glutamate--2,6-diaminopimelate ligase [Candidatus Latescibacterota bacterium]